MQGQIVHEMQAGNRKSRSSVSYTSIGGLGTNKTCLKSIYVSLTVNIFSPSQSFVKLHDFIPQRLRLREHHNMDVLALLCQIVKVLRASNVLVVSTEYLSVLNVMVEFPRID